MPRSLVAAALLFALLGDAQLAAAQRAPVRTTQRLLRPSLQTRVLQADTSLAFRTRPATPQIYGVRAASARLDADDDVLRAAYRIQHNIATADAPEATARRYLADVAPAFGFSPTLRDLKLDTVQTRPHSRHVIFQQIAAGRPVYNRRVKVGLDQAGQPAMVVSGYAPHVRQAADLDRAPQLSQAEARQQAQQLVTSGAVTTSVPELVVYPSQPARLAWRLLVWPEAAPAEWEVLVDAQTGAVIQLIDQAVRLGKRERGRRSMGERTRGSAERRGRRGTGAAEGTGQVFDPDPLSTVGAVYDESFGAPYNDGDDQNTEALRAAQKQVPLHGLTRGNNGRYRLEGPYAHITGRDASGETVYEPPAEPQPDAFTYTRAEDGFEAVNAYYHIDKSQRYVQQLGFTEIQNAPLRVNPQAVETDASLYYPGRNFLEFGTGGVDDAEDASVVWHEYGHALLEAGAAGLRASREGQALHEGWADYWAASYARHLVEKGAIERTDWERLFKWDSGDGAIWAGRVLDSPAHYPEDTQCDNTTDCNIYEDGLLWATVLMEIYTDVGREVTDRLNLASHTYLSHPVTFRDAAEALIQADKDLYSGVHVETLLERFSARGLVNSAAYGPTLAHEPLPATEQTGGTVEIQVRAQPASAPVEQVHVIYGPSASPGQTLTLEPGSGDHRYVGQLPLPTQPDTVHYYIEAVDETGQRARLPAEAPSETYRFETGPDHGPPQIAHMPIDEASLLGWPAEVTAEVRDRLAIDSVGVRYVVEDQAGNTTSEGRFGLAATSQQRYRGAFPVPAGALQNGSTVRYRLYARDAAQSANEAVLPASGWFAFRVQVTGVLRAYDFEGVGADLSATGGQWQQGRPSFGTRVAPSGQYVYATAPDGAYQEQAGRAALRLPALNLSGLDTAYLVFWHWYDFEHDGTAHPEGPPEATLWDGGNVKLSTDGGASWQVADPEGGYNGIVAEGRGNPLGGEPAFGGYSYGWRRVVVPLPTAEDVRLRFDIGTDAGNTEAALYYAGWYLDDLTITTERPQDNTAPTVTAAPPVLLTRSPQQGPSPTVVELQDDTGIAEVLAAFEAGGTHGLERDTVRLAMSETSLHTFRGLIAPTAAPALGDSLTYRLRIRDFAGNTTTYPSPDAAPLRIRYRNLRTRNALRDVRPSGRWQRVNGTWSIQPDDSSAAPSSLVLAPTSLPENAEALSFVLFHRYHLPEEAGATVKLSLNDGASWSVLAPEAGYPASEKSVFAGASDPVVESTFDLTPHAGRQVWLRVDLEAGRALQQDAFWTIQEARFRLSTPETNFDDPRALRLHPNFPNPFSRRTTFSYTLPEPQEVQITIYDVLGRRVAVLTDGWREAGTHTVTYEADGLAPGIYFLRLMTDTRQKVEQMVIMR